MRRLRLMFMIWTVHLAGATVLAYAVGLAHYPNVEAVYVGWLYGVAVMSLPVWSLRRWI